MIIFNNIHRKHLRRRGRIARLLVERNLTVIHCRFRAEQNWLLASRISEKLYVQRALKARIYNDWLWIAPYADQKSEDRIYHSPASTV